MAFTALLLASKLCAAETLQSQIDAALRAVAAEEMVFDAQWQSTEPMVLDAMVFDNGTNRGGYAGYLCMILEGNGLSDVTVNVVDVASKERRVLGSGNCRVLTR